MWLYEMLTYCQPSLCASRHYLRNYHRWCDHSSKNHRSSSTVTPHSPHFCSSAFPTIVHCFNEPSFTSYDTTVGTVSRQQFHAFYYSTAALFQVIQQLPLFSKLQASVDGYEKCPLILQDFRIATPTNGLPRLLTKLSTLIQISDPMLSNALHYSGQSLCLLFHPHAYKAASREGHINAV